MLRSLFGFGRQKRFRREAEGFLNHLRSLDDLGIAIVLAIAAHQRNAMLKDGTDLSNLTAFAAQSPDYHNDMARAAGALLKSNRAHDALGLQVWIHSLRAIIDPSLRELAIDMWRLLARGRQHLARAREDVRKEAKIDLDITHGGDIPPEFQING